MGVHKFYGGGGSRKQPGRGPQKHAGGGGGERSAPIKGGAGAGRDREVSGRGGQKDVNRKDGNRKEGNRKHDDRFASRFADPKFQVRAGQGRGAPREDHKSWRDASKRGAGRSSKKEREDDDEELEVDADVAQELDEDVAAWNAINEDTETIGATRRVAVVNCDWDHVRALDVFAILNYAVPIGGRLLKVSQYMSDYGRKALERERMEGPDLWLQRGEEDVAEAEEPEVEELPDDLDDDSDDGVPSDDGWVEDDPAMMEEEGEDGERFSKGKYRQYEMNRMKYFYCVAEFDTPETAMAVYAELDGLDIESSGVALDLRYIEDAEQFDGQVPLAVVDKVPANFKPLSSFKSAALSQTKFRLSWDQDDVFRTHSLRDAFNREDEEDDLAAYIASDSDDEDDEASRRAIREQYRGLLDGVGGMEDTDNEDDGEDDDENENEEEDGEDDNDDEEDEEDGIGSSGSDDELNRFSDVEMDSDEEEDEDEEEGDASGSEASGSVNGDMEATFDLGAEDRATQLQKDARQRAALAGADLGTRAQLLHKQKRREARMAKQAVLAEERLQAQASQAAEAAQNRSAIRKALGANVMPDKVVISGTEKRRQHARVVKERVAQERASKKVARLAQHIGGRAAVSDAVAKAEPAVAVDDRFKSRLTSDPRFHLDVSLKGSKDAEIVKLAAGVAKARQREGTAAGHRPTKASRTEDESDAAVSYFLNKRK